MHPHNEHRQSKVEKRRVGHITHGYASGGAVHSDEAEDKALVKKMVKPKALKMEGGKVKHRADRPGRAHGGRMNKKHGTTVNVINAGHPSMPPPMAGVGAPPAMAAPPVAPAMPPHPPMAPPMAGPPGMPPPMMPPRKSGGRVHKYAKGGRVNEGSKVYEESMKAGTQISHDPGKNDGKDLHRGKPITYATGGRIYSPEKGGMGPKLEGGAGGGEARLEKEKRAAKNYRKTPVAGVTS